MSEIKKRLEDYYRSQVWRRECGMRNVLARIQNMKAEVESMGGRNIFYNIESRIKTFESAYEKIDRKGLDMSEKGIDDMHDIAGVRIIVPYEDDIYTVRDLIKRPAQFLQNEAILKVTGERDYVTNPKENGYRAYHIITRVKVSWQKKFIQVPVEIQLMTRSMKLWADYEHKLKYKNPNPAPNTVSLLKTASDQLRDFDKTLMQLRDYSDKDVKDNEAVVEEAEIAATAVAEEMAEEIFDIIDLDTDPANQ